MLQSRIKSKQHSHKLQTLYNCISTHCATEENENDEERQRNLWAAIMRLCLIFKTGKIRNTEIF